MPVQNPPFIPRFGAGAPAGTAPPGTLYFQTDANYQEWTFQGGQWNKTFSLQIGTGVPAFLAPAGMIFSRTDVPHLYMSTPAPAASTVLQHGHNAAHNTGGSVTFGAPVTTGNLLIGWLGAGIDLSGTITAGWNLLDHQTVGGISAQIVTHYAQAGDGATPPNPFLNGAATFWGLNMAEISGVTGVIGTDIVSHILDTNTVTFNTTTPQNTAGAGQLCLLNMFSWDGTANFGTPAGWASVETWNDAAVNYGSMSLCSQTPGGVTNVGNATVTRPAGSSGNNFADTIIMGAGGLVAGWTLLV